MVKEYEVAIIGAGTAGLTARAEVAKRTDDYVVLDGGVLGTTCARVGCMPSKTLIEVANTFHKLSFHVDSVMFFLLEKKIMFYFFREIRYLYSS